jgi:hypothetical protein
MLGLQPGFPETPKKSSPMTFQMFHGSCLRSSRLLALLACPWLLAHGPPARAATIGQGDATTALGPAFFVDDASAGGSDATVTQPTVASYTRSFAGLLNINQGPTRVVLTGFGFASSSSTANNTATTLTVTFTYLGADEAVGGGDDVAIGSATGTYLHTEAGEYVFAFATPLTADLDITGTRFRIQVAPASDTGNGKVLFKTGALTYESSNGPKFSVAGIVAPPRLNLAKFQPVTASSVNGHFLATYLTDGNAGNENRWESAGGGPHWARVDFPFPVEIGSAHLFTGFDDTNAQASFRIQSLAGTAWLDAPGAVITGNTNVERAITFTTPVTATAFRIHSSDGTLRVREFALFAPTAGSRPPGTDVRVNLAWQRPATATSATAGNFALLAVDGRVNEASKWQTSTAGAQALEIDLRVSTRIGSAHLYSGSSGVAPLAAFDLESWDGTTWQPIPGAATTGNTSAARVIAFTTPVATSRVRLVFTNPGTTSVRELCVFPANEGNAGYPPGTNATGLPPLTAKVDDYRDAFHLITNAAAGQAMAVSDGAPRLHSSGLAPANRQYQILLNLDNGTFRLRNRATGLCLSGAQLSIAAPGAPLIDAPYAALPDQDWILARASATHFCLVNAWSGLVIDTHDGATAPGTPLVQNPQRLPHPGLADHRVHPRAEKGRGRHRGGHNAEWRLGLQLGPRHLRHPPGRLPLPPDAVGQLQLELQHVQQLDLENLPRLAHRRLPAPPARLQRAGQGRPIGQLARPRKHQCRRLQPDALDATPPSRSGHASMAMDMPLVSPAPAGMNNGWLADFYTHANSLGHRVDYTALHAYPGPSGGSANNLINTSTRLQHLGPPGLAHRVFLRQLERHRHLDRGRQLQLPRRVPVARREPAVAPQIRPVCVQRSRPRQPQQPALTRPGISLEPGRPAVELHRPQRQPHRLRQTLRRMGRRRHRPHPQDPISSTTKAPASASPATPAKAPPPPATSATTARHPLDAGPHRRRQPLLSRFAKRRPPPQFHQRRPTVGPRSRRHHRQRRRVVAHRRPTRLALPQPPGHLQAVENGVQQLDLHRHLHHGGQHRHHGLRAVALHRAHAPARLVGHHQHRLDRRRQLGLRHGPVHRRPSDLRQLIDHQFRQPSSTRTSTWPASA